MYRPPRREYLASVGTGASMSLGGCLDDVTSVGDNGPPDDPPVALVLSDGATNDANLHAGRSLATFRYDEERDRYHESDDYRPGEGSERITSFAANDGGYIVTLSAQTGYRPTADRSTLALLGPEMSVRTTRVVDGVHALTTDGGFVYSASERGFSVFDSSLEPVGSVDLPREVSGKHMEEVVVHDGFVYVVDDVISPMYVLRIDVAEPSEPAYHAIIEVSDVNPSLGRQWFELRDDRWLYLLSTAHQAGAAQYVVFTSMDGTADPSEDDEDAVSTGAETEREQIFSWDRETEATEGTSVDDVTTRPPNYASVTVEETHYLSSIDVDPDAGDDDGRVSFGYEVELDAPARVDSAGEYVLALTTGGDENTLLLYDAQREAVQLETDVDVTDPLEVTALQPDGVE